MSCPLQSAWIDMNSDESVTCRGNPTDFGNENTKLVAASSSRDDVIPDWVTVALASWGALLSTTLGGMQILVWKRDRALLDVEAVVVSTSMPSLPDQRDPRLTAVEDKRGLERGLFLNVSVINRGRRTIQIIKVFFSDDKSEQQVTPRNLPAILDPNTRVDLTLQLEWVSNYGTQLRSMGALDALGRRHPVDRDALERVVREVAAIPTRVAKYKRKEGSDPRMDDEVTAFQAYDPAVLIQGATNKQISRFNRGPRSPQGERRT